MRGSKSERGLELVRNRRKAAEAAPGRAREVGDEHKRERLGRPCRPR